MVLNKPSRNIQYLLLKDKNWGKISLHLHFLTSIHLHFLTVKLVGQPLFLINTTLVYNLLISTHCIPKFNSEIDCRFSMCWEKNVPMTIYLCVYHVNFTCFINRMRKRLGRNFVSNIDCEVTCNWIVWLDKRLSGSRTAVPKNVFVLISITLNLSTYLPKALSVIFLETKENATIV